MPPNRLQRVMHSICAVRILLHIRQDAMARRTGSDNPESVNFEFNVEVTEAGEVIRSPIMRYDLESGQMALSPATTQVSDTGSKESDSEIEEHWFGGAAGTCRGSDAV